MSSSACSDRLRSWYAAAFDVHPDPGMRTVDGIADIEGHYPSTGAIGERAAWFHDSEGDLLGVGQLVRADGSS